MRGELDELSLAGGVGAFDEFAEREADPGDDNRPSFNTAMTVDALLGWGHLEDGVDIQFLFFFDLAIDLNFPGARAEFLGEFGGFVFLRRKFVVVVVVGDVFIGSNGLGGAERALLDAVDFGARQRYGRGRDDFAQTHASGRRGSGERRAGQKLAAVQIQALGSDFRRRNVWRFLDQHGNP